ncbi:MAG: amidase [Chloroflexi bacterium]|nr:amidase [Chloroflexota bacterium]
MEPITYFSATALANGIRKHQFSSREVVEAHLARIETINPKLNAVAQLVADTAVQSAAEADAALDLGEALGPLHGVPFTVKDWIETAGVICAAGSTERKDFIPRRDATVVARMRAAGAIMLAKTIDGHDNPVYGHPNNPYDLERTPGGSSSGEAALIAAGGSPVGLGSDSGGSIRFPAHCCGIAGLKPTNGRVPITGHFPRINPLADPRTQIGPMARQVEDLALLLPIISGVDWRDSSVVPVPLGDWKEARPAGLRIATYTEFPGASASPDTAATIGAAANALQSAGAEVEEAIPPRIEESLEITRAYWRRPESHSWNEWETTGEHTLNPDDIERSIFQWDRFRRAFLGFMRRFDAILCPVADSAAGHGAASETDFIYTLPFSLTGYPCVVVRAGVSTEGLPIGVQVVAQPWRDDVALGVAHNIETALGGWQPPGL